MVGVTLRAMDAAPTAARPSLGLVVFAAFVGLFALLLWPLTKYAVTIAHEGGHATFASIAGRTVERIELYRNGDGVTWSKGRKKGLGVLVTGLAGYLGPSLFGLLGVAFLVNGAATAMLWSTLVFLAIALVMVRNLFGIVPVVVFGVVVFFVARDAPPGFQTAFACALVWFLLFGGVRSVFLLSAVRRAARAKGKKSGSDADILAGQTHVPGFVWTSLFGVGTIAALLYGGAVLLGLS